MKKIIFFILATQCSFSQIQSKSDDVFEELETGNLTLRFYNAVNGQPVQKGTVTIEKTGEYVTDEEGKVIFPPPAEDGFLKVLFHAKDYVPTEFSIEIMAGTLFFNRISISPMMDIKFLRVVVDWDKEPRDLDAHFVRRGSGGYHISYRNMKVLADGTGMLDIDAMNGFGPETITLKEVSPQASYEYFVHDYTHQNEPNSNSLSNSKATVKVYGNGTLLNIFQVPRKKEGTVWKVFEIVDGIVRACTPECISFGNP